MLSRKKKSLSFYKELCQVLAHYGLKVRSEIEKREGERERESERERQRTKGKKKERI